MANKDYMQIGDVRIRLIEELAEFNIETSTLIQSICKAERFGLSNINPLTGIKNADRIISEIADVRRVLLEMEDLLENKAVN